MAAEQAKVVNLLAYAIRRGHVVETVCDPRDLGVVGVPDRFAGHTRLWWNVSNQPARVRGSAVVGRLYFDGRPSECVVPFSAVKQWKVVSRAS
jgi:hypothetical protein